MGAIYRREMSAFFTSPIAYVYLSAFYFFAGLFYFVTTIAYATSDMSGVFGNMFLVIIILVPVLTMKLLSEDKKQKTDQCLLTAPVSLWSIVFGKYFAALTIYTIGLLVFIAEALALSIFGTVSWAVVIGNVLGVWFLGAAFLAIGLFASCLTENQVVAYIIGFAAMLLLYMIDVAASFINVSWIQSALYALSVYTRYNEFSSGIFNFASIFFFLSLGFIFNFLTVRVLEKRRWS